LLAFAACGGESELPGSQAVVRSALTGAWQTGASVGYGVAMMDTGNPLGASVFIGYAGFNIGLGQAQAWVGALYDARLRSLGVRYLFAVQGPADSGYNALEIGNSRIAAALSTLVRPETGFVVVAGHSSGSFVADELLQQLEGGADPSNGIGSRLVFFNLDGDQKYVGAGGINRLRRAYYVNAYDGATHQWSWNHGAMSSLGATFASKGGSIEYDASSSGCTASGCVHISLVSTVPHDPSGGSGSGIDYADFGGRPVNQWWLDAKQGEAGLGQCATPFLTEGLIEERYAALGGCSSTLGNPSTNMLTTLDGAGRYNNFTYGSIYWSFFTGAHEVRGAILSDWAGLNYENGPLGYPVSDELVTLDGLGRYNRFQHGAVYWSFGTGAHAVVEPVYAAWANANFENGALGYPLSDTRAVAAGAQSEFQHGSLTVFPDGGVALVLSGVAPPAASDAGSTPTPEPSGADAGADEARARGPGPAAVPESAAAPLSDVTGGCSATGGNASWVLATLAVAWFSRRRKSRAERGTGLGLALLLLTGCGVEPSNEEAAPELYETSIEQGLVSCTEKQDTGYTSGAAFAITVVTADGKPCEVGTANAYSVMQTAATADGVSLVVVSGFRTMAEQQYFFACYTQCNCNGCNLAAQPGYSNHQSGHALDLNTSSSGVLTWLNAHGPSFGFNRTVPSEAWHWEYWGGGPGGGPCGNTPSNCTNGEAQACGNYGCNCVDHACNGGFCPGPGCTAQQAQDCGNFGCGCVDGQCAGGYCPGSGCTAKEALDCSAAGCGCVDHLCRGGASCAGSGCTAKEALDCGKFGCNCADHECGGGYCPNAGCTPSETAACSATGCGCVDHQCAGGACEGNGCTARQQLDCTAADAGCAMGGCAARAVDAGPHDEPAATPDAGTAPIATEPSAPLPSPSEAAAVPREDSRVVGGYGCSAAGLGASGLALPLLLVAARRRRRAGAVR
jgi:uncharacterized protein (TIGR03382 family)